MARTLLSAIVALFLLGALGAPTQPAEAKGSSSFVYLNDEGEQILGYKLNSDGSLDELSNSPWDTNGGTNGCSGQCQSIIYSSGKKLLFASTGDGIAVFKVDSEGDLTEVPGSPFQGGASSPFVGMETFTRGGTTYVAGTVPDDNEIRVFKVQSNGALLEIDASPFDSSDRPIGIIQEDDQILVVNVNNDRVRDFKFVGGSDFMVEGDGSPFTRPSVDGRDIQSIVGLRSKGKKIHAYVGSLDDDSIYGIRAAKKGHPIMQDLPNSTYNTDTDNASAGLALGKFILIALSDTGGEVQVFHREGDGELLAVGSDKSTGLSDLSLGAMAQRDDLLLVVGNDGSDRLRVFEVNRDDGTITEVDTATLSLNNSINGMVLTNP